MNLRPPIPLRKARLRPVQQELHSRPEIISEPVGASYVWLAYSIFFFIEPLFRHKAVYWLECLGLYAVFLLLYTLYVRTCAVRVRLWLIGGMFLLGLSTLPFNSGATCFFTYVVAMLPFNYPTFRVMLPVMLAVEAALVGMWFWLLRPVLSIDYLVGGFFVLVVGISNTFVAQGKQADLLLKAAQEENVRLAATAERERIARDLHDVLGHTLSVVVLKAELAGRLLPRDPARAAAEIAEVEHIARTALTDVREAITGYRGRGLRQEIDTARLTLRAAGVELHCTGEVPELDAADETVLALALREAVTNVVRHAAARVCRVSFAGGEHGLRMAVEDDGQGSHAPEGNGLRGMRERVLSRAGRVEVRPGMTSGSGTCVLVQLPERPALAGAAAGALRTPEPVEAAG